MFDPVQRDIDFDRLDQEVLDFWRRHEIPRRSFVKDGGAGTFTFYEGPPTANGKPGIHHVSTRSFKDIVLRYKTMQGYRVGRRGGWDTHGLPVEVEVEKEIGSTSKRDVEDYGVAEFNRRCRESVFRYIQDWNELTERIGYWLDLDDAYVTYENRYIESCWWILRSFWDRGLLFEDYKVTMHCPRCNSTLAEHEVSQGMRDDADDPSVWVKFPVPRERLEGLGCLDPGGAERVSLLIWTTTPWTLPANSAIALAPEGSYAVVRARAVHEGSREPDGDLELYVVASDLLDATFGEGAYERIAELSGSELVDLRYEPVAQGVAPADADLEQGFRVVADPSVELSEGTGLVHIAPAYGDLDVGRAHGVPTLFSVDLDGRVMPGVRFGDAMDEELAGRFFKDADPEILRALRHRGLLYRSERVVHAYPFCWRDGSPLLFYAKRSWYVRTTAVKDQLLANNRKIHWVPRHIQSGRFGNWLENNVDWALSRERFWGTPLPIWESEDGEDRLCVGSLQELEELVGRDLGDLDLHRPYIDEITFEREGRTYRRVPDTIDVWFDSGAMPYAQWHYPFENADRFADSFPADFICEAMDQTRGWFYSLHALATLLTDSGSEAEGRPPGALAHVEADTSAYRTCMVLGFINDAEGRKMSKSRGNAVDPWTVLGSYGADALRWYLYTTGSPDQNKNFDPAAVSEGLRSFFLTLWNVYAFFVSYARLDQPDLSDSVPFSERPFLDRWILSRSQALIEATTRRLDQYQIAAAARGVSEFVVDDLSNWYLRRSRRRFWRGEGDRDKQLAYRTLYEVLGTVTRLVAPFAPFVSEAIYQNLVRKVSAEAAESVHLADWPVVAPEQVDEEALSDMELVMGVVGLGRTARSRSGIKTRQPLAELVVHVSSERRMAGLRRHEELVLDELNVKRLRFATERGRLVSHQVSLNWSEAGPRFRDRVAAVGRAVAEAPAEALATDARGGRATTLTVDGEEVELPPELLVVETVSPEGYETLEDGDLCVALATTLTEELVLEGRARDLVRVVQVSRKNADLDLSDRIELGIDAPGAFVEAIEAHRDYIEREALAERLVVGRLEDADHEEEFRIAGEPVTVTLQVAAREPIPTA